MKKQKILGIVEKETNFVIILGNEQLINGNWIAGNWDDNEYELVKFGRVGFGNCTAEVNDKKYTINCNIFYCSETQKSYYMVVEHDENLSLEEIREGFKKLK